MTSDKLEAILDFLEELMLGGMREGETEKKRRKKEKRKDKSDTQV